MGITKSGNVITFPNTLRGNFQLIALWQGTNIVTAAPTITLANCSFVGSGYTVPQAAVTANILQDAKIISITTDGATVTYGTAGTIPAGSFTFVVYQVPLNPPTTTNLIFDKCGRNRQAKYDKFFERFNEKETDFDNWVTVKETDKFGLEENLDTKCYAVYCNDEDDDEEFPVTVEFAERIKGLPDDLFDLCVKEYIMSVISN
jgi:hypothetical protein